MIKYTFWNNKGGTGKTSLCFHTLVRYAEKHPEKNILVIDVCPQANLSELLLGGLVNSGSNKLVEVQESGKSVGQYFQDRLSTPYSWSNSIVPSSYLVKPSFYHSEMPSNIDLLSGNQILELQSNAISTLANTQLPGQDTWFLVLSWLSDFLKNIDGYDMVFIDTNPSFSMYTQIAIYTADKLIVPVMPDDSSRRAIKNVLSLVYGIKVPSVYKNYSFSNRVKQKGDSLPQIHLIIKNRITQYMGSASAYDSVFLEIDKEISDVYQKYPEFFSNIPYDDLFYEVRDFQTTGVISFAYAIPFTKCKIGRYDISGKSTQLKSEYIENCKISVENLVAKFE